MRSQWRMFLCLMLDIIAVMHLQLSMKPMWICAIWKLLVSSTLATLSSFGRTCSFFNFVILLYVTIYGIVLSCHASRCDSWEIWITGNQNKCQTQWNAKENQRVPKANLWIISYCILEMKPAISLPVYFKSVKNWGRGSLSAFFHVDTSDLHPQTRVGASTEWLCVFIAIINTFRSLFKASDTFWRFPIFDKDGWQSSKLSASLRLYDFGYVLRTFKEKEKNMFYKQKHKKEKKSFQWRELNPRRGRLTHYPVRLIIVKTLAHEIVPVGAV